MRHIRCGAPIALVAAATVAAAARRARALSPAGALAATAVGGAIAATLGIRGGAALVAFFASATLLGRLPSPLLQRRGNERDAVQVLANGGVAALLALAFALAPTSVRRLLRAGFGGAVAAAAADTWATEIGSRYGGRPRSIITLNPVEPGVSGGVTLVGLAASAAGAALTAAALDLGAARQRDRSRHDAVAMTLGGIAGALADSVLGAALQEVRLCVTCGQETELLEHACGTPTIPLRGVAWCSNDTVNALATAIGAATAIVIAATRLPDTSMSVAGTGSVRSVV